MPLRYFVWVSVILFMACLEDMALLGSNPSAEAGTKTEEGDYCCPLLTSSGLVLPSFNLFGIGIQAINPRGLGTESPEINRNYPH
jgi:hypothetical protein